jgi:hypothetical protein
VGIRQTKTDEVGSREAHPEELCNRQAEPEEVGRPGVRLEAIAVVKGRDWPGDSQFNNNSKENVLSI